MKKKIPGGLLAIIFLAIVPATDGKNDITTVRAKLPQLPIIGDKAPDFQAETTEGKIDFPEDYKGKWVVVFSHPGDFTPVCTSEFVLFGSMARDFKKLNTELLGLSVDDVHKHKSWKKAIQKKISFQGIKNQKINFPIIADADGEIAWRFGMLHPTVSTHETVRALFIIDPKGIIRAMLYYPPQTGRNISEIKRLLIAIQTSDAHQVSTPANWKPGDPVLIPGPAQNVSGLDCQADFFCLKDLPRSKLHLP